MPLYKIMVEYQFAVEAESEEKAYANIPSYMRTMDDEPYDYYVEEIKTREDYPDGYDDTIYPYGGRGSKTLGELLDEKNS